MFPTAHPDFSGPLANQRAAGLWAEAERHRRGRPMLARWRPARFVEPAADLSRVVPAELAEATPVPAEPVPAPTAGRAA